MTRLIWFNPYEEIWHAQSGNLIVGTVMRRNDGQIIWYIDSVHMKWIAKGRGESDTIVHAKKALGRAWRIWLKEAGL